MTATPAPWATKAATALAFAVALLAASAVIAGTREPVLKQIDLPHDYYWREQFLPQLTAGPSSAAWTPDGKALIYSMAGSLWRQAVGSPEAVELTHASGAYDYQPDISPDGRWAVFTRYDGAAMELWRLDLASGRETRLTTQGAVNVEPRISPNGKRLAFVSTIGTGHFNLFVAEIASDGALANAHPLLGERKSRIDRYYYSAFDHAIDPAWSPDGARLYYVANPEVELGTGDIWSASAIDGSDRRRVVGEETMWQAAPAPSPDGRRLVWSSYHGRQWRQLWLTTPDGAAPLPMSFGDFDRGAPRWSPDGMKIAFVSNETGGLRLIVREVVGGAETPVVAEVRRWRRPMGELALDVRDGSGRPIAARVSLLAADGRAYGPDDADMHGEDAFDRSRQPIETHYVHCPATCRVTLPAGLAHIVVQHGFREFPWVGEARVVAGRATPLPVTLTANALPAQFGQFVSADLHVHMNYGGHYRMTPARLAAQMKAEDLDVVESLIVNKEERVPDIAWWRPAPDPASDAETKIFYGQEFHTSWWGHLGLLGLTGHLLEPGFASYRHTALASPWPTNGVIADLAHAQGALVGYVHPFDAPPDPMRDATLTDELPADVAMGKIDYIEVVGFSDHRSTADVWYRLLNLGLRLPTGAGADAMTNYASLRGPVGLNRVYLATGGRRDAPAVNAALKAGRTFATNGPLLGLTLAGQAPRADVRLSGPSEVPFRLALRSPVPIDHLELVEDGKLARAFSLTADRRRFDAEGTLPIARSGWLVLRAWNDGDDPLILDRYPYATTSPIYLSVAGAPAPGAPADATFFTAWLDRLIANAAVRDDYDTPAEKEETLAYLRRARALYAARASPP